MEQAVVRLYCVDSTCVLVNHAVSRLLRKLNRKQCMHGFPQMMSVGKLQACDLLEFILKRAVGPKRLRMSWFSFSAWLHIHLASSYLCTQLYPSHIQQTFYGKKKKKKKSVFSTVWP